MRNKRGQTVLEVLIALTLIILFLSGIVVVQLVSIRNVEFGQNKSIATKLARQQLERAKVIRDSGDISSLLTNCLTACYINSNLTPMPNTTPTGTYGQSLTVELNSASCPQPQTTPPTSVYKVNTKVNWSKGAETAVTPVPEVELASCLMEWR